jgi:hypothetical protein
MMDVSGIQGWNGKVEEESDEGVGDGCKTKPKEKQNKG